MAAEDGGSAASVFLHAARPSTAALRTADRETLRAADLTGIDWASRALDPREPQAWLAVWCFAFRARRFIFSTPRSLCRQPGTEIGRYVIRYEHGAHAAVPLRNGREVGEWWGDWWGKPLGPLEAAWRGMNRLTRAKNGRLNLFKTTWTNPRPDPVVATIHFVSGGHRNPALVVAISRE